MDFIQKSRLALHEEALNGQWTGHNYQEAVRNLNLANTQPEDVSAGLPAWVSGSGLAVARNAANTYNLITGFQKSPRRTLVTTVINAIGSAYRNDRNVGESVNTTTQALYAIDQIINGRTTLQQGLGVLNLVSSFNPQNTTLTGAGQVGGALSSLIGLRLLAEHPYYESHSTLRRFYAGELPKTLSKLAANSDSWRIAA